MQKFKTSIFSINKESPGKKTHTLRKKPTVEFNNDDDVFFFSNNLTTNQNENRNG